jgi:Zn-dependent protease
VQDSLQQISLWILPILVAVVFHEVAHGYVANWLGDPTAALRGRLTLNPLAHVDPIGTVIVPLFLLVSGSGLLFGWAKPVPVNYQNLGNPRRDMVLVAAAGPLTNLVIAVGAAVALRVLLSTSGDGAGTIARSVVHPLALMAFAGVQMNVFLGVFNLLPIPPLDGGRVLTGLLPVALARRFQRIEPFGFLVLIALLMTNSLGVFLHAPIQLLLSILLPPFRASHGG